MFPLRFLRPVPSFSSSSPFSSSSSSYSAGKIITKLAWRPRQITSKYFRRSCYAGEGAQEYDRRDGEGLWWGEGALSRFTREGVNLSFEWFIKRFRLMCLCAAIIGPDLGLITHTVSLFDIFIFVCVRHLGLKTRFSQGNEQEGRKCAWPTWRARLGLAFDILIKAILEQLGSRTQRSIFPPFFFKHNFDPYLCPKWRILG